MKAKEFIIELKKESKPRNFVAKNASLAGKAGQHKDKKKAEKQGDVKHKTKQYAEDAVADFLARGGEIQHGKFRKPRKSEKTDYGSKHIGGQRDAVAGKAGKTLGRAAATNFKGGGKPVVGSSYRGEGVVEAGAADPVAARVAAAPYGYNTDTGKPNPPPAKAAPPAAKAAPTTPAAPPAAKAAAPAAKEPIVQATDDMEQRILDRMGKRFGLPPGSTADQVQAAQQAHLDKNDPAAAAQYKQNMANIDAGGAQADNAPLKLAPTAGPGKVQASPDDVGGMAAAKAGKSPIAIMLAQPTIGKNQAMLDVIAPTVGLPAGSSAEEILAADDARNAKAKNKYAPAATAPAVESAGRAVDAKGRTQQEWVRLVKSKFPNVKLIQAKMIDGPIQAILPDGRKLSWNKVEQEVAEASLGNYREKALKQKAQSRMGAMFNEPDALATFNKRERGLNRLKARDEVARKTTADKQMADNIAKLPELKAEYDRMKAEYKSLGGSNWQYADREQNLTDREREARSMEGPMNNLWRTISAAEKAQKSQGVGEGWKDKVAAAGLAGAMAFGAAGANARVTPDGQGGYTGGFKPTATVTVPSDNKPAAEAPKGFSKEYLQKAANPDRFGRYMISVEKAQELLKQMDSKVGEGSMFAGAKVGHKEGPAGQWRNDGAKKNKPAKPGDLVGGGM